VLQSGADGPSRVQVSDPLLIYVRGFGCCGWLVRSVRDRSPNSIMRRVVKQLRLSQPSPSIEKGQLQGSEMVVANGTLTPFADGVWVDTEPVRFLGLRLTATMAVLRLGNESLLLYSQVAMTPERRAAVEALGPVAHLYAPNLFHHFWIGEWAAACPSARVHAPGDLAKKCPDLRVDRVQGVVPEPAFAGVVDEVRIEGFRLHESVLVFRPSQTLVVADLVHNIGRPPHRWTMFYARAMGFYDRVAVSRMIRWTAFSNRTVSRRSIDDLLARYTIELNDIGGHLSNFAPLCIVGAPCRRDQQGEDQRRHRRDETHTELDSILGIGVQMRLGQNAAKKQSESAPLNTQANAIELIAVGLKTSILQNEWPPRVPFGPEKGYRSRATSQGSLRSSWRA
jgi:hypothetical protein